MFGRDSLSTDFTELSFEPHLDFGKQIPDRFNEWRRGEAA